MGVIYYYTNLVSDERILHRNFDTQEGRFLFGSQEITDTIYQDNLDLIEIMQDIRVILIIRLQGINAMAN